MSEKKQFLLSAPVLAGLPSGPGAVQMSCDMCQTPVWIDAKTSSATLLREGAIPVCIPCAADYYEDLPVAKKPMFGRVTPEQREELGEEVMARVDAAHPLTILRQMAALYKELMAKGD